MASIAALLHTNDPSISSLLEEINATMAMEGVRRQEYDLTALALSSPSVGIYCPTSQQDAAALVNSLLAIAVKRIMMKAHI
ncbi:MAG: hypothetical protein IPM03_19610 [Sulfuritalea sp.]|nr:hypothetical protein [Sulfuritalea sp.]